MRNIYEIIAQQKALVDINISSYQLDHICESNIYLQESLGESIKKGAQKVVEFIKSLIKKIKELVSRVLGFLRKSSGDVEAMEKRIEEVNKEKTSKLEKPDVKGVKLDNLMEIIKHSTIRVEGYVFNELEYYTRTTNKILTSIDSHLIDAIEDDTITLGEFDKNVSKSSFMGAERDFDTELNMFYTKWHWSADKSDDKSERQVIDLKKHADDIYDYARNGAKTVQAFKKIEKNSTDSLNKLIRSINSNPDEKEQARLDALVMRAGRMISSSVNYFSKTVTRATSQYIAICRKVTDDYCSSVD